MTCAGRNSALLFFAVGIAATGLTGAACSSSEETSNEHGRPFIEAGPLADSGLAPAPDAGPAPTHTTIDFDETTKFGRRDCTLTLKYQGRESNVQLAGEFTNWASDPLPLTRTSDGFEITLSPSATMRGGVLYAYKLIADGTWKLDPTGTYRKIVEGQMNSALRLPTCEAGPELRADHVVTDRTGTMNVRVSVRVASDGSRPEALSASLDRTEVKPGMWTIDAASGAVDFHLKSLAKGKHTLSLRTKDAAGREADPVDLPFWIEDESFDYRDGLLYMFLVDRFANGDKTNDLPIGAPVDYDADWHGGDLQGALAVLRSGYFEKLGVRTLWLSPANAQTDKYQIGDGAQNFSAYHGYWPIKARSIEPRFGGDAALRAFVTEAHNRGLRVLLDLINNQVHDDHEYVKGHPDWFRKECKCGDDGMGCGWSQRPFDCNFQMYLPDINWTNPNTEKQFIDDAVHWISEYSLDGFRVDAVKHVEANSVFNMRAELARRFEQGGARIFMVGETAVGEGDNGTFFGEHFGNGFEWIDAYTGEHALDGQFDFPLRHNMADGLVNGSKPLSDVENEIAKAEHAYRVGHHHVRFLNGHDNPRIASVAAQDPKLGCLWSNGCRDDALPPASYSDPLVYARLQRALTVLYSLPGVPYLYAGDEVAMPGGSDPDMRRDMRFAESELRGLEMVQAGRTVNTLTPQQIELRDWARKLGEARRTSRALRRGERITLLGTDPDLWVYAYKAGPREIAIVAINRGPAIQKKISASALNLLTGNIPVWTAAVGTGVAVTTGNEVSITIGEGAAAIFIP